MVRNKFINEEFSVVSDGLDGMTYIFFLVRVMGGIYLDVRGSCLNVCGSVTYILTIKSSFKLYSQI